MNAIDVKGIGTVDFTSSGEGYWEAVASLGGHAVCVDFNAGDGEMTRRKIERVEHFVENLGEFDAKARDALSADCKGSEESDSCLYLTHHLEELDADERIQIFGTESVDSGLPDLLASLRLKRVGLYPDDESRAACFDYTLSEDLTDYVLVVEFDQAGTVVGVSMES